MEPVKDENAYRKFVAMLTLYTGGRVDVADPSAAAFGAGYLAYKVAQQTSIVENAKEFAADAAKELAIYALVDKEAGSKMGGRQ